MNIRYQILLWVLTPVFLLLTLKHFFKYRGQRFLKQRYFATPLPLIENPTWFHCASVGEVVTATPLIELFHQNNPDQPILVTTATITGANTCSKKLPFATHCYLPLDYKNNIKRFIRKLKPQRLIVLETEIWPNLFSVTSNAGIVVDIVNGRLSKRSTGTRSFIKKLFDNALKHVSHIYCRTAEDADAFTLLGARQEQVKILGNLKFSAEFSNEAVGNFIGRRYVIAASTRDHEEKKIVKLWQQSDHDDLLLVIAPRHPERKERIVREISPLCQEIIIRSEHQAITDNTDVYIADTFGEMAALYRHAEFVLMGGSFVDKGGQNLLEPARLGKAVIFGLSMENFAAEAKLLLENNAALQARNDQSVIDLINCLQNDVSIRNEIGEQARKVMQENRDVANKYYQALTVSAD